VPFSRTMGADLWNDYRDFFANGRELIPERARRPFLVGRTRDEIINAWGSPVGTLFAYLVPRIFFTPMQQRVLLRACRTPTPSDPEIADELGIERSTLRDHWRAIFARSAAANILHDLTEASPALRPALVAYLEQHPEELRPIDKKYFSGRRSRSSAAFSTFPPFEGVAASSNRL